MSAWTERVPNCKILEHLAALGPAIDQARERAGDDPDAVSSLERIRTVLTFIGKRLDGADGALLPPNALEKIGVPIVQATALLANFVSDGSSAHLEQANASIDSAIAYFGRLVLPTKTNDLRGLREAADSYRDAMSQGVQALRGNVQEVEERIATLSAEVAALSQAQEAERQRLGSELATLCQETEATQAALKQHFDAAEAQLKDRGDAALSELKEKFDGQETERAQAHETLLAEQRKAFDELRQAHDSQLKEARGALDKSIRDAHQVQVHAFHALRVDYEEKAKAILETIEGNLRRVQELVGVIGDHGVTSGHKIAADDARSSVRLWQCVTVGAMMVLIVVAAVTAFSLTESAFSWLTFARRAFLSVAVSVLAAYAASQAHRYQIVERRNRKLELELKALGPFLEPVEAGEREKFRLKMAEAFFGRDDDAPGEPAPATLAHLLKSKDSIELLRDLLSALASSRK